MRQMVEATAGADTSEAELVDAAPVRRHVFALAEEGMCARSTAWAAGVSYRLVHTLLWGRVRGGRRSARSRRIPGGLAQQLLAVRFAADQSTLVLEAGTARSLQALALRGWSASQIADRLGWNTGRVERLTLGDVADVTAGERSSIEALHDQIWDHDGRDQHTRALARFKRWHPLAAFDEDVIDDPEAAPAAVPGINRVQAALGRREEARWLASWGISAEEIAARAGIKAASIYRAHQREVTIHHRVDTGDQERTSA